MANDEQLGILRQSVRAWNLWRRAAARFKPDLRNAKLFGANLSEAQLYQANLGRADLRSATLNRTNLSTANLSRARLVGADLYGATLGKAKLLGADLSEARLYETNLSGANLSGAKLRRAQLVHADLSGANLSRVDLTGATLRNANLGGADLSQAILKDSDLTEAFVGGTIFGNTDLSTVIGLETILHRGPSSIGIDTLFRSDGKIPEVFLRGAGVPEDFITFVPSLVGSAIEFYSCFISYSHQDEEFSRRLHARMRSEGLRVWYAPEDMKAGRKLHEEIFRAIQIHDKLLLVLSEDSMKSEWVMTEIRRAKKVEREENRRKLFPIRLVDFETIEKWECFDADSGKDLAAEVREYYIPDFSNWKDHDSFEQEFAKLLRDLRATEH